MWFILWGSLVFNVILLGVNLYKTRVIEDYETRLPRVYQGIVNECNELKGFLELEERSSREPFMRGKLNEMICKYARHFRKEQNKQFENLLQKGCEKYIKKN